MGNKTGPAHEIFLVLIASAQIHSCMQSCLAGLEAYVLDGDFIDFFSLFMHMVKALKSLKSLASLDAIILRVCQIILFLGKKMYTMCSVLRLD